MKASKRNLPAAAFYGVILAGVTLGVAGAALAAMGDYRPEGRRIWADVGKSLVVPVAAMVGGTFGGLAGVVLAIAWEKCSPMRRGKT